MTGREAVRVGRLLEVAQQLDGAGTDTFCMAIGPADRIVVTLDDTANIFAVVDLFGLGYQLRQP